MASKLPVFDGNLTRKNVISNRTKSSGDKDRILIKGTRLLSGERNMNSRNTRGYECETKGKVQVVNNKSENNKGAVDKDDVVARK